ncbi:MAG: phosphotransferase [Planctomycetota bacterium]
MSALQDGVCWLTSDSLTEIEALLRRHGWCQREESVSRVRSAGEGNMNVTLRVTLEDAAGQRRRVILKQSRPWVAKYPSIEAPVDRISVERRFYELLPKLGPGGCAAARMMPKLLGGDAASYTLLLEDLGNAADLSTVYARGRLPGRAIADLAGYLRGLHDASVGRADTAAQALKASPLRREEGVAGWGEPMVNAAMRALNREHFCEVPMAEGNGLDLEAIEPGLKKAAAELRQDVDYRTRLVETAAEYARDGSREPSAVLLHGDFFPGSWLDASGQTRVIDPEFAFEGPRSFDVGVAVAHLILACRADAAREFLGLYGSHPDLDRAWVGRFAAMEVMRRLIGVAQLPLPERSDGWRAGLVLASREAMLAGDWEAMA